MIYIDFENLNIKFLNNPKNIYLIFGEDIFLQQKTLSKILKIAKLKKFKESYTYNITKKTNWNEIYQKSKNLNLFSEKKIFILKFLENENPISKKILKLINFSNPNLLIILLGNKINQIKKNIILYKKIKKNCIYFNCSNLEKNKLFRWINKKSKKMSIKLTEDCKKLLCLYYERNLLGLEQILKNLLILYPDKNFSIKRIKKIIKNTTKFESYHWIESIFLGKTKRSLFILKKLKKEGMNLTILLYIIQKELILIFKIKQEINEKKINEIFNKYKIWNNKRLSMLTILNRLSTHKIQISIQLISKIELEFKKKHQKISWDKLEILTILLCKEKTPNFFEKYFLKNYYD